MFAYDVDFFSIKSKLAPPYGEFFCSFSSQLSERINMSEKLQNILWMAEELDFTIQSPDQTKAEQTINQFLESAGNTTLSHSVYSA